MAGPETLGWVLGVSLAAALAIAAGLAVRIAAAVYLVGFGYLFVLEQANYLNHHYLMLLLAALLVVLPPVAGVRARAPRWAWWLVRGQLAVAVTSSGLAKCNSDWLCGWPLRLWLPPRLEALGVTSPPVVEGVVAVMTFGGLALTLAVVPALLWSATRRWAAPAWVGFHLLNAVLFDIGVFPWLMLASTSVLVLPDAWPARASAHPEANRPGHARGAGPRSRMSTPGLVALAVWLVTQALIPQRHWLTAGWVDWNEAGHRFAWRMKLRSKTVEIAYIVRDPTSTQQWRLDPRPFLTSRQARKLPTQPEMIRALAVHIAARAAAAGSAGLEVYADGQASLNGRPRQPLVDPSVNLAVAKAELPAGWILPLVGEPPGCWTDRGGRDGP